MNKVKQFFLQLSLKRKWSLATSSIILFSYMLVCFIVYFAVYSWLLIGEEQRAARTAEDMYTFFLQEGIYIQNLQQQSGLLKSIIEQDETVRIYNFDGIELLRINNESKAVRHTFTVDEIRKGQVVKEDGQLILYRNVHIGPFEGYMQLIHPLTHMEATLKYIVVTMGILGLLAIVFTLLFTHYIVQLLLRPIELLRKTMVNVRDKGIDAAEPIPYAAQDELGELLAIYEEMMVQLEHSFKQQQRFVYDASHELRTPIQAIEGHLSLVQRWGKDDPAILAESIQTALLETKRMKHLLEELLKLAKSEPSLESVQTDIESVLQNVIQELRFVSKPFHFKQHIEGERKLAYVSEQALGQIFRNIMENSIRYSANDCTIEATIHYAADSIYVQLTDNGIGIAEEHLPHIFERFYRVDASRQHIDGSAGLGLSITDALARKYNIDINVDSSVGKGTTFLLRFSLLSAR